MIVNISEKITEKKNKKTLLLPPIRVAIAMQYNLELSKSWT